LRCTLFIDTSQSVRLGPPGHNALARLVDISAAVAQATAAARDLSGLCLFDDAGVTATIRPARGTRHLVQLLNILADAAGLAPATGEARIHTLLPLGYALANEIYPYLLNQEVNQVPAWLPWFWQIPAQPNQRPPVFRLLMRSFLMIAAFVPFAGAAALVYLFSDPLAYVLLRVSGTILAILGIAMLAGAGALYLALFN